MSFFENDLNLATKFIVIREKATSDKLELGALICCENVPYLWENKNSMHLSRCEKSIAYKQIFRNFPTICAIMRFFWNYANYVLRAELCDFALVHNSGSHVYIFE